MLNPNEEEENTEEISMATTLDLKPPPPFDAEGDNSSLAQRWKEWRERFNMYTVAANIEDDAQKCAVLLYVAGPSVHKIFKTLQDTGTDFKTALEKLDEYFQPQKNVIYERYVFKQTHPTPGESVDSYITRLRTLAETCEFESAENEIRDQFVMTCSSHGFHTKLLRETDLTLAKLITMARVKELAEKQALNISGHNSWNNVNRVKDEGNDEAKDKVRHAKYVPEPHKQNKCRNCGNEFKQGHKEVCPAKGKTCRACGKLNHFARVCRSRKNPPKDSKKDSRESVRVAQQQTQKQSPPNSSDDEYTFAVSSSKITNIQIQINGTPIAVAIDSGATTNILDSEAFACIRKRNKHVQLEPTQTNIYAYNAVQPLPLLGKCHLTVESNGKRTISTFYVVNGKAGSLLGNETAAELGILKIKVKEVSKFHSMKTTGSRGRNEINTGSHSNGSDANSQSDSGNREIRDRNSLKNIDINTQKILDKFPELSDGIGCLQNYEQSLHVDRTVTPIAQRPRRVPFHLRKQVSDKLEELQSLDIIEPAEGPTSWVSPIVAAPKPHNSDEIRLCGDYRRPNQALLRERHPIPTVDELMEEMSGAVVFSKLDLKAGYHQIVLEENSRNITTFCTHKGLFRYKRLPFGLSCASEVFQNAIQQALQGLNGVRNIADDIIVWDKTQAQHDKNLEALLQRLVINKLTLNLEKSRFNQPSLWFYGYILSKDGLSADPKKVEAIKNFKTPADASQLRGFLGLANYCSRFIKDFSTLTAPLRELTTKSCKSMVLSHSVPKSLTLDEIRTATLNDPELQSVTSAVKEERWNKTDSRLSQYRNQHEQLTVSECGVILRNSQIVIPKSLRSRVLSIAHEGHQGIVKTKMLVRSKVWWPGVDKQVEQTVKECIPCQAAVHQSPKCQPPLNMTKLPPHPWHTFNADFCGPFQNGEKLLVVIDAYSRYPEVEVMQSTTTTVVISKLQRIFARHGYPEELITDNGPPFNAVEFTEYLSARGVHHRRITPYWPQANCEAERFMKTVTKAIRTAHSEGKRWQSELDLFLLNYRSTPHSTTHTSPAELLFNRSIRNKLPSFSSLQHGDGPEEHRVVRDKEENEKMKVHADRNNNAKESQLKVGDYVLMQVPKDNKLSMSFNPKPFQVIEIKGNMVTARNTERIRNVSFFKCLTNYKNASEEDQNDEEEEFDDDSNQQ
ncbi:Uncharacterized protein K02A2.6 [Paramuricea clavata]|uniref:Uncharacterized protein K02A2.6 n=1 Tax=Paramuricea clavata TaxID=317549 RepID=A0A6S7GD45_PARCT|nr:Uncharacterized protein K02A2.6 [Paramuricea clavata]